MPENDPQPQPGQVPALLDVHVGRGRTSVRLELRPVGLDWLLLITGGEQHVGAVALAEPGSDPAQLVRGAHREGPLAATCAAIISAATGAGCVAVGGIHQDEATGEEIVAIVGNAERGARILAAWAVDRDQR